MTDLVQLATDGGHRAVPGSRDAAEDPVLEALLALRTTLGSSPENRIGARLPLPLALGIGPTDQVLPASLTLLAGAGGDLTAAGWRLGPGRDHAWRGAVNQRQALLDAARIAWLGVEGTVQISVLGPVSLAAGVLLAGGQRALMDAGALRDLPGMLAEGLIEHAAALRERVPGASIHLLVREDTVGAAHGGRLRNRNGRGYVPALSAARVGACWGDLLRFLGGADGPFAAVTLESGSHPDLLTAGMEAGAQALAITPSRLPSLGTEAGRRAWEQIAAAHESGIGCELLVDPGDGAEADADRVLAMFRELGFSAREAAGMTLLARAGAHRAHRRDPVQEPTERTLLEAPDLDRLLRLAPAWAEKVAD